MCVFGRFDQNMEQQKQNPLGTAPIAKLLVKFAIPSVISLVVNSLYNIVDQIFIGQGVGYLGNAATSIVFPITVITMAFAVLFGDGTAAYFSLKMGENDLDGAKKGVGTGLSFLIVVALFFLIADSIFLKPLLGLFGCTPDVLPYAIEYGRYIILGFPFVVMGIGLNGLARADGSPRYSMIAMLIGAAINCVLDPLFIFTFQWGVRGAAIATIAGQIFTFVMMILYLPRFKSFKVTKEMFGLRLSIGRRLAALGISSFITQVAGSIIIAVSNNQIVTYGGLSKYGTDIPLAAFGIVMKVNQIIISVLVGIGVGAQPILGFNYGAKNYARVKKTYLTAITAAIILSIIGGFVFQFFPQSIVNIFGNESDLYNEFAVKCFRTFLMLVPLAGLIVPTGSFFQAIGKPTKSAILSLSRQILFMLPCFIILPIFFKLDGVLYTGPVSDFLAFILALIFILVEMKGMNRLIKQQTVSGRS